MDAKMERSSTIKRRDAVATRASILAAAHQRFLREAYENVGLRDIAGDAGVDVALISRYFGGKEGLFREPKSIDELPGFLAQLVAEDDDADRHHRMEMFVIMLRSASSPKAGDIIRELVNRDVLEPLAGTIGGDQGEMRANMLLAILMGVGVLRTIMKVDNFELDAEEGAECVERFRCLFAAALTC
jgi:AcrR family transcriptional regulator